MSSTISRAQVQSKLKMDVKLVRTSSMEKFKRFNSYICSQHYYIVPALLTWLKSSQFALKTSAEKTIFIFRSIFQMLLRSVCGMNPVRVWNMLPNTFLLYASVYLASCLVYVHLLACIYLLAVVHVPSGLYFLIISISYITFLCYKSIEFDKKSSKRKVK